MSSLKNDCSLFSRLYIASQTRHGDLDAFFQHENQACPPSLSQMGGLRTGTKSELMPCLVKLVPVKEDLSTPEYRSTFWMMLASSTCFAQGLQRHSKVMPLMSSCRMSRPSFSI